ncbi:phosphatase [Hydrogenophaga crassostreae]|uniref:Phosphatase n=1 Tax=Hydrogenophaga crassostreae TaxID=1763535 RepID=A0A170AKK7_9BURK|nr:PhoX family phosphatase [Hydrogenophaga crassostreae]AOW13860.1 phosphatase [Hydrogenophaga crassostreae]OAD44179.1 phosphatase [Hydrogenophaga crassostreae]
MSKNTQRPTDSFSGDDINTSANPQFDHVLQARLSRRNILRGSIGMAGMGLIGAAGLAGCASSAPMTPVAKALTSLGFKPVAKGMTDAVIVPEGYSAQVIYALGDPLSANVPAFKNDGTDEHFDQRAGDHHDGMEWFGLDEQGKPSRHGATRGLIAMNHEATTDEKLSSFFIHANGGTATLPRPTAEVDKELMIHGLSVVEMRKQGDRWAYNPASGYNRRVTTMSEAAIHGPARGSEHLVTRFSSDASKVRGTLNNCGAGPTPWGTYVSGEENWFGYFHRDAKDDTARKGDKQVQALNRYGRKAGAASRHGWESAGQADQYARWNNSATGASAKDDYRNEMNTFGYIVELDPYDKAQVLRKRSALGRMGHENVTFSPVEPGKPVVAYMGDDSRGEYMYKFVSDALWDAADASNRLAAGDKYLDKGTLYVARFKEDGTGEWIELSMKNPKIAGHAAFQFTSEADVAIFTRLAADAVGATKMDRPEWGGVNPRNGEIYFTLTNNSKRTAETTDAANPRYYTDKKGSKEQKGNVNGHIMRMAQAQPADVNFRWDIYLFASEAGADRSTVNLSNLTDENDLSSPDGLVFSKATGICWIETDDGAYTDTTNCMLLAALPGQLGDGDAKALKYGDKTVTTYAGKPQTPATLKRFLVGPKGAEITGICETPDGKALFINIQHPGENTAMADVGNPANYESQWPANIGYGAGKRPRSATIVITKNDGGLIGA